ncbi:glycogen debranching protein [Adhaeribacter arboris]|uniref:Glycogen debranching protein n=1 Tax=Adhaeribacter arboris TaxID=2072846 RepID=A0A2T2YKT7_9BACT|nr:amylo-alpha-1,6-glucosidase [Adhaeribacter arboris]PSR56122.1 glycogen debranching protein [Adhaeribacter arboris]
MGKFCQSQHSEHPASDATAIWQSEEYTIYPAQVVQQNFVAHVLSPTKVISNYVSSANNFLNPLLTFKFSINGHDNEMEPGKDHQFVCIAQNGYSETPIITFGSPLKLPGKVPTDTYLTPNTKFKIRLNLSPVLDAFEQSGFYTTYTGEKIYQEDFKGVFVAGQPAPLTWNFANLANQPELELQNTKEEGIFEVTLLLNPDPTETTNPTSWQLSKNTTAFPQYSSGYPIMDALYNLGLEEMLNAVEPDNTFRTGKEWAGVWTRDISYSIILAMAIVQPQVARKSLLRKVNKNRRIIQDTGTGGAYPVSSDRIVWAIAAWELYTVTSDTNWLKKSYRIIKNSLEDDLINLYNPKTGLFRGESSFLDWREQTYPQWMQPADIYESECLSTNALFYQACNLLAQMANLLADNPAAIKYSQLAEKVKSAINEHLWLPAKGYYGQFRYGRNFKILSPKAEALGEALCVLFDIADDEKQQLLVARTPITPYGIPCIYPQIPTIPSYHNNAVWPFVQAYWSLATAKAGNEKALLESMSAIYRPAALFLTNQENFVASNGDYAGTQINSSNMLWSLAGNLSLIYKVIFGMELQPDGLVFKPMVPKAWQGLKNLKNFTYRNAILDIGLEGYGNQIKSITLNDKELAAPILPATLQGQHFIKIELENNNLPEAEITKVPVEFSPTMPEVSYAQGILSWQKIAEAENYKILRNGKEFLHTRATQITISPTVYTEYQIIAVNNQGHESFASEPLAVSLEENQHLYSLKKDTPEANLAGEESYTADFLEISKNTNLTVQILIPAPGLYAIDFRYANGEGPISTNNKCAIRTLKLNNKILGTIVLPQRGADEWSDWGFTNAVQVRLEQGPHDLALAFEPTNENMNTEVNRALLDYMRVTKIAE